jgi:H+/Cl- antiporter ClcA
MTNKKHNNDEYELPAGIILPEDNSTNYPNWKKGIIFAIPGGFFGAFASWLLLASKVASSKIDYTIPTAGFVMGFLMVGSIIAFRPPKN